MKKRGFAVTSIIFLFYILVIAASLFTSGEASAAAPNESPDSVALPILMYHSILNSKKGTYIVSERQLDDDLTALEKAGYSFIFPSEAIAYAAGAGNLPEKPVMITFDDGYYNNMHYGLPILKKHHAKALINIVGFFSDKASDSDEKSNPNYSHLTWAQIGEAYRSGAFEIGNHSYEMHAYRPRYGMSRLYGETDEEYRYAIRSDLLKLQNKLDLCMGVLSPFDEIKSTGVRRDSKVRTLAFPYGKITPIAKEEAVNMGFDMLLTCTEGVSVIKRGVPDSLFDLKRMNRAGYYGTERMMRKIADYTQNAR